MSFINKVMNKLKWKYIALKNKCYKLPDIDVNKSVVYVLGVSNHPNAGDQEITLAQEKFIKKYLPDHLYIEIEKEKTPRIIDELCNRLKSEDYVFIQGGGTLSDLYPEHEVPRQLILKKLRYAPCPIIQFPVSFYYKDIEGFRLIKDVYNNVKNLTIFARESKTFDILRQELSAPVYHVPDIVLSQDESSNDSRNDYILIMFRHDQECLLPPQFGEEIISYFSKKHSTILTDNYVERYVPTTKNNRDRLLSGKFNEFRKAKFVITDRLHGMIFAYITKTPAIVFDNSYGKVSYSYRNWLSDCHYIKFIEADSASLDDIVKLYNQLVDSPKVFSLDVDQKFGDLISMMKNNLR